MNNFEFMQSKQQNVYFQLEFDASLTIKNEKKKTFELKA